MRGDFHRTSDEQMPQSVAPEWCNGCVGRTKQHQKSAIYTWANRGMKAAKCLLPQNSGTPAACNIFYK
jgi:hypothetical protein